MLKVNILLFEAQYVKLQLLAHTDRLQYLRFKALVHDVSHFLCKKTVAIDVDIEFFSHLKLIQQLLVLCST